MAVGDAWDNFAKQLSPVLYTHSQCTRDESSCADVEDSGSGVDTIIVS